jgi:phage-related protein
MNGLMKIGTEAIGPLMESLGELWSALFGEDVDLSGFGKFILDSVITVLKGLASFIKEDVVPTVKMIHEAFQTASEIIGPPLKMIADAVGGFIKTLHDAFEGFYNWLVGGSLWMDMWNQLLSVASELVGKLLGDLGTKLFEPMKNAFTGAMQAVEDSWNKGWEAVHAGFETVTSTIQTGLNTKFDEMKSFVQTNLGEYGPIATGALDTMQSAMNAGVDLIKGDWQGALDHMQVALTTGMQTIGDLWDKGWQNLQTVCTTVSDSIKGGITVFLDSAKTTVGTGIDNIKTSWETGWQATQAAFTTISQQIGDAVNTKFDEMKAKVQTSTGEYAPTMTAALSAMQSATNAGMDLIKGDWQGALDHAKDALNNWGTATKGVMDGIMNGLQGAVKVGLDTIKGGWDTFVGGLQSGVGTLQSALDSAGGSVQQALDAVGAATTPATSTVTNAFTSAFNTISTAATSFWNWLTGHSLWPDMLDRLSGVTRDKLLDTASAFSGMFGSIEQELSNRFQNMFEGTKGAMGMMLQVIASSLIEIRDNFMSTIRNVEASWSDAWTEINRVAASTTQQVFDGLTTWWSMLQANFMTGLTAISGAWQTSWTSILETVANVCGQIGAGLTTWYQLIQDTTTGNLTLLTGTFQNALTTIQSGTSAFFDWTGMKFTEALAAIGQLWQNTWMQVETVISNIYANIQKRSMEWWTTFSGLFSQGLSGIQGMFVSTFANMASAAASYMSMIAASVANALAQVIAAATQMRAQMVTGSIWPDMLEEMQAQATSALGNIVGDFQGAFGDVVLSVPTMPSQAAPSRGSEASAPLISQLPQSITIPITVTLDGQVIARLTEQRIVERINMRGKKVA